MAEWLIKRQPTAGFQYLGLSGKTWVEHPEAAMIFKNKEDAKSFFRINGIGGGAGRPEIALAGTMHKEKPKKDSSGPPPTGALSGGEQDAIKRALDALIKQQRAQEQAQAEEHAKAAKEKQEKLEEQLSQIGLLELAQLLHESYNGVGDPIPAADAANIVAYLKKRLAQWRPPATPSVKRFDACVRAVVEAAVAEQNSHVSFTIEAVPF